MSMPYPKAFNVAHVSDRAVAYGIPGESVDGNEALAVYMAVKKAADRARRGEGPSLIEAVTYRYKGHSKSDKQAYRTRDEVQEWMEQRDPIMRFAALLTTAGIISEAEAAHMRDNALRTLDAAVDFSEASPPPDVSSILEGVYA
jgi:TPP-dependent pyruvate/acetoin dehydrogenase alpha subunit